MTVAQLRRRMNAQEEIQWRVLEKIDPWGQLREDHRFALLGSAIMNAAGAKKQDGKPFTSDDLLLKFTEVEPVPEQTTEQIEAAFRMAVAANNAFWAKRNAVARAN